MESEKQMVSNAFTRFGALARTVGTGGVSRAVDALGERRATEAFANRRRAPKLRRLAGLGTVLATAVAALVIVTLQMGPKAVSWTVDGAEAGERRYISPADENAAVRFSEGTEFSVQRGSRLRVVEAGAKTVKAVLEVGAAHVRISKRSPIAWKIEAGPFSVSPTAVARIMVEWLADELLRVSIFEGETSVQGTPSPLHLHAGQQVSANAKDGTVEVGPLATAPAVLSSATPELRNDVPARPLSDEPLVAPGLPSRDPSRHPSWSDAVARGDYAGVLRDAERRGISAVLEGSSLPDLVAVADAARLSGRIELGQRCLVAERTRFGRTGAARDAAFYLGRIADDHEHALSSAISWYETYLSEAPQGHFAVEAFGRKMVAISRQSGRAAARPHAIEYLKRFPTGPHAALARDVTNE